MTTKKETTKPTKAAAKPVATAAEAKQAKVAVKAPAKPKAAAKAKAPVEETKQTASVAKHPSHEEISRLAAQYWAERGYHDGHADQDWQRAEHDLRNF
jgi:hypothetical protein